MRFLKRFWRYARYALLALVALVAGAAAVLTLTQAGRGGLANLASSLASGPDRTVRISGLGGVLSGHLRVARVVIEDGEGAWLALRDVEVDWSPLSLLGLTFSAERVHAGRVEVARLPQAGETSDSGGSGGLPVQLDIRAIDLPDIGLGEQLAGSVARLAATGRVRAGGSPLSVEAALDLTRTDGQAGKVAATLAYQPDDNRLELSVDGSEPAGGVIANLLKLPGRPPVAFTADGGGPASNWAGKASFSVDGKVAATLTARHQFTDAGSRIEATGDGAFQPFLPASVADIARGTTRFTFAGTLGEGGAVHVEQAELASETISATASGAYDPQGLSDLTADAKAVARPVVLAYGEGAARLDATLRQASLRLFGPADALGINLSADLASAGTADHRAENLSLTATSDAFDARKRRGRIDVTAHADAAGSSNAVLAGLLAGALDIKGAVDVDGNTIAFATSEAKTGTVQASAKGSFAADTGVLSADLTAEMLSAVLPAAARGALDRTVTVSAHVGRGQDGAFRLTDLDAASGALKVAGEASYGNDAVAAELTGALSDLSKLSAKAAGAAQFSLSASGAATRPEVKLAMSSDRMTVAGRAIEGLKLDASGTLDPAAPTGRFQLGGSVGGKPLKGAGTLAPRDGRPVMDDLKISLGENQLEGALTLAEGMMPDGTVTFSLPDIASLAALALVEADGSARGSLRLDAGDGHPAATLDALVDSLNASGATVGEIRVNATARDYLARPTVGGAVSAGRIVYGKTEVRDVSVTLRQDGEWTGFDGSLKANAIPVSAKGRVRLDGGTTTVELSAAGAELRGIAARLARPTTIAVTNGTVRLDGATIAAAGGTAAISGSAGKALDLSVTLASLPAAVANQFAPGIDAQGTLSGSARITGSASAPQVAYQAQLRGGQLAQTRAAGFGAMNLTTSGRFAGNVLTFDARLNEGSGLGMSGGGSVDVARKTVDASLSGKVPFGFLARRLAAQGVGLDGGADVALKVSGNLFKPDLAGTVKTAGARFLHAPSGMAINDLAATITLGGGTATISSLTGALSTGGTVKGSGTVQIDPDKGFPAELSLALDNGRYTDGRVVTANLGGQVKVTGALVAEPLLSGTINLGRTVVTIPERLPASLDALGVKHRNAPAAVADQQSAMQPATASSGGAGGVALDLQVNAPQEIFVQGRGLDAELGGSLKLTGPASAPEAVGRFDLRRGRLDLLGRRLQFTSGSIGFSGSMVPYLNLKADSTIDSTTVTVVVTGPATNPSFAFESSPALPQDEILARLVFGKAMSGLSPLQIAQLAAAAGQLAGVGGSTSLLQNLRNSTGLDDIDVKTDDKTGDTSVAVGKYLNDKTYLTIEKGSQPGSGKATIDLELGKGVKLRGEATDNGKTRGGLFYEKEY